MEDKLFMPTSASRPINGASRSGFSQRTTQGLICPESCRVWDPASFIGHRPVTKTFQSDPSPVNLCLTSLKCDGYGVLRFKTIMVSTCLMLILTWTVLLLMPLSPITIQTYKLADIFIYKHTDCVKAWKYSVHRLEHRSCRMTMERKIDSGICDTVYKLYSTS